MEKLLCVGEAAILLGISMRHLKRKLLSYKIMAVCQITTPYETFVPFSEVTRINPAIIAGPRGGIWRIRTCGRCGKTHLIKSHKSNGGIWPVHFIGCPSYKYLCVECIKTLRPTK